MSLVVVVLIVAWLAVLVFALALGKAAARGDRMMDRERER